MMTPGWVGIQGDMPRAAHLQDSDIESYHLFSLSKNTFFPHSVTQSPPSPHVNPACLSGSKALIYQGVGPIDSLEGPLSPSPCTLVRQAYRENKHG